MSIPSQRMSLAQLDQDAFLNKIHYSLERVRFAVQSYDNFKQFIRIELDEAIKYMEQNVNKISFDLSEDQLTLILLSNIKNPHMGIQAFHEDNQRGHCDITIKLHNYTWHGEAKKHTSAYSYLFKGYAQLTERYSSGSADSCSGGLIIYSKNIRCKDMMDSWSEHLKKCAPRIHACRSIEIEPCQVNPLVFHSRHTHKTSGLPYEVTHYPINFHYDPADRKL